MTTLVHITDAKSVAAIRRNGIRPVRPNRVIYFMPVVASHFVSHQWLRELRRGGARLLVGVYFQWPKDISVWAGRYNQPHENLPLSEAIRRLNALPDPRGFEMFAERTVGRSEINAIRALPQTIGWRYHPDAHGEVPCPCPACQRGRIKSAAIRARDACREIPSMAEVYSYLSASTESYDPCDERAMWRLRDKRRKLSPAFLEHFLCSDDTDTVLDLAETLAFLRHATSKDMLRQLVEHPAEHVRAAATRSLATWANSQD